MEEEPSYVRYRYLVTRPPTMQKDPEVMRRCREVIQNHFKDKIVKFTKNSPIMLENTGIDIGIDKRQNINSIKITFNVLEENPTKQEWRKYSKLGWSCHSKLIKANRGHIVKCFLTFNLRTIIRQYSEDGEAVHTDTLPDE